MESIRVRSHAEVYYLERRHWRSKVEVCGEMVRIPIYTSKKLVERWYICLDIQVTVKALSRIVRDCPTLGAPPRHTDPFLNPPLGSLSGTLAPKGKRDESQWTQVADATFRDKCNQNKSWRHRLQLQFQQSNHKSPNICSCASPKMGSR